MGGNQCKWCPEYMQCCHTLLLLPNRSIMLILDVSFPEGWGIQQQHGGSQWKGGIITSHSVHTHTHLHLNDALVNPAHTFCDRVCMSTHAAAARSIHLLPSQLKRVAHPLTATRYRLQLLDPPPEIRVWPWSQKLFSMQLIIKQNLQPRELPIAAQLLEMQSSSRLTSWLALLPNKAPIVWNL